MSRKITPPAREGQRPSQQPPFRPFSPEIIRGTFVDRPNRFVIRCTVGGSIRRAYLPNPGRLWEILLPGTAVSLVKKQRGTAGRLPYVAVAAYKHDVPVLLHTHLSNDIVARLLERSLIPGLEDARVIRREFSQGHSRFDFLLEKNGSPFLLEVKSCTLFGRRIAMFPDAVTERGRRHLTELAALARTGTPGGVVFLVHAPQARFFLPDYHTDPDFARTLYEVKDRLLIKAVAVQWRQNLTLQARVRDLTIPWELLQRESRDRGAYILILQLAKTRTIDVGGLGTITFRKGFYLYAGAAGKNLGKRIERHLRINKNRCRHVDYLRAHADRCTAVPIRSGGPLEHELAQALLKIAEWTIPRFGSSDCTCATHLVGMEADPLHSRPFIELLSYFRIDRLENELPKRRQQQSDPLP